jgi:uncharacterized membrane protein HdeD (DUF308 family)
MRSFKKAFVITLVINIILYAIAFAEPLIFVGFFALCVLECVFGLLFLISSELRPDGQGMLLAGLICLVIGFSICSTMTYNI